jgi:hypothetical protein
LPFSIVLLTERTEKLWVCEDNAIEEEREGGIPCSVETGKTITGR